MKSARVGDRTRTGDNQIHSLENTRRKAKAGRQVTTSSPEPLAYSLARQSPEYRPEGPAASLPAQPLDPDLASVVHAWPDLPEPIRAAMLAMVGSAAASRSQP